MQSFFNNIKNLVDTIVQNIDFELPLTITPINTKKIYNGPITIIEHTVGMTYLSTPTFSAKAPIVIEDNSKPFLLCA